MTHTNPRGEANLAALASIYYASKASYLRYLAERDPINPPANELETLQAFVAGLRVLEALIDLQLAINDAS